MNGAARNEGLHMAREEDRQLRRAFRMQRATAKSRGREWLFSFEEWLQVWTESGHLTERGRGVGRYVMARFGDVGPYSRENVEIIPFEENSRDARANHKRTFAQQSAQSLGRGRGWTRLPWGYQVSVARKYYGTYATAAEAERVYKEVCATRAATIANQGSAP